MTPEQAQAVIHEAAHNWLNELDEYIVPATDAEERASRENEAGRLGEAFHTLQAVRPTTTIKVSPTKAMMAGRALVKLARENESAAESLAREFPGAASNAGELASWYREVGTALLALDRTSAHIAPDLPEPKFTTDAEATA